LERRFVRPHWGELPADFTCFHYISSIRTKTMLALSGVTCSHASAITIHRVESRIATFTEREGLEWRRARPSDFSSAPQTLGKSCLTRLSALRNRAVHLQESV
jgi:hypothetical protein